MALCTFDIYCRVVDNLGDAGVCWRLAADLAARGHGVRLVIDDLRPLGLIAPGGTCGVEVRAWPVATHGVADVADVVIEAFGCDPPPAVVAAMGRRQPPPVWVNLEYLSAESYVERSHGLPSPQPGGLIKRFFYPGFTARTGGLLREPGLLQRRAVFDRDAWLRSIGVQRRSGERVVNLFCYDNAAVPALLLDLARVPTLLLLTPGPAQAQVGGDRPAGPLRVHRLPWLSQTDFDHLLWAGDLNAVRGEDSLVRALWAGVPFLWQAYPQRDGAHAAKVQALIDRAGLPAPVGEAWWAWNGSGHWPGLPATWSGDALRWRDEQAARPDLVTALLAFVAQHRTVSSRSQR